MLEGRCSKCGSRYFGWALRFPRNQVCNKCGSSLEIFEDGKRVSRGYSPFEAEEYTIKPPTEAAAPPDKEKAEDHTPDKK